ncbi:hypothetical protein PR202_ga07523 [Eleusine coracana subsp. coracana]|uniref:FAS1 domain-containing protein n=1 Tax=Eleusine coracana subsp. coracana TaxID=191504 RepID=A0AAV5BZH6_ELECO|nr:hypothetical protein PR202_ga07523 [Eleusine coracana subsp. coracana]
MLQQQTPGQSSAQHPSGGHFIFSLSPAHSPHHCSTVPPLKKQNPNTNTRARRRRRTLSLLSPDRCAAMPHPRRCILLLFLAVVIFLSSSAPARHATALHFTAILSGRRSLAEFSRALAATGLADAISRSRAAVTFLAVDDAHMAPLTTTTTRGGLPREALRRALSRHVLAGYYDDASLRRLVLTVTGAGDSTAAGVVAPTLLLLDDNARAAAGAVKIVARRARGREAAHPESRLLKKISMALAPERDPSTARAHGHVDVEDWLVFGICPSGLRQPRRGSVGTCSCSCSPPSGRIRCRTTPSHPSPLPSPAAMEEEAGSADRGDVEEAGSADAALKARIYTAVEVGVAVIDG